MRKETRKNEYMRTVDIDFTPVSTGENKETKAVTGSINFHTILIRVFLEKRVNYGITRVAYMSIRFHVMQ